jgi:hypothetical protein
MLLLVIAAAASCQGGSPASPAGVSGTIRPSFLITHVVYATLANARIDYNQGSTFGATLSATRSFEPNIAVQASAAAEPILTGGEVDIAAGRAWGSVAADTADITATTTGPRSKEGRTDTIDHVEDEIWLLLAPEMNVTITPAPGSGVQKLAWQLASTSGSARPFFVHVGELQNPATMRPGVKEVLDQHGITAARYADLLAADPFAAGATSIETDRFELVTTFPFIPRPRPEFAPSTQTWSATRPAPSGSSAPQELTYSVDLRAQGERPFTDLLKAALVQDDALTWTASTVPQAARPMSTGRTSVTVTVGQPPFGYPGPTILRVYFDKLWKTYLFAFEPF